MKKVMLGALTLAVCGANSATAADLGRTYTKAPPTYQSAYQVAPPVYNWTGFYVGGHLGGAFGSGSSFFGKDKSFLGGLQVGGDYQFAPNWLVGIEGQYSWLPGSGTASRFGGFDLTRDRDALGSITGRLGYAVGPSLLYAKGGWAYQDVSYQARTLGGAPVSVALGGNSKSGYTVGAGLEYLFTPNWSTKIEYQYYNFGSASFIGVSPAGLVRAGSFDNNLHTVKIGLNYRFN